MHSHLREQVIFDPVVAQSTQSSFSNPAPPQKKQKMSVTQTYYLAHTARGKLSRQASRADHDLRLLVGHANLLDNLMIELQDAERQQEAWFNQSVTKASREETKRIQWADTIVEDPEDDCEDDDAASDTSDSSDSSDSDSGDLEDIIKAAELSTALRRAASQPSHVTISSIEVEEDEEIYDDEFDEDLALTRVSSRSNPPELTQDSDDSSDDESPPASPPAPSIDMSLQQGNRKEMDPSGFFPNQIAEDTLENHELIDTTKHGATMIAAY